MQTRTLWTGNTPLNNGTVISNLASNNNSFIRRITVSGEIKAYMKGACCGSFSTVLLNNSTYDIPANYNTLTFPFTFGDASCCNYSGNIKFTQSGNTITFSVNATPYIQSSAPSNITYGITNNATITKIELVTEDINIAYPKCPDGVNYSITRNSSQFFENNTASTILSNPNSAGFITVCKGDVLTISASAKNGYNAPSYNFANGTNSITVNTNTSVSITAGSRIQYPINITKLNYPDNTVVSIGKFAYAAHPSFDCDGDCYCYCQGGHQVPIGEDCPDIYESYTSSYAYYGDELKISVYTTNGKKLDYISVNGTNYTNTSQVYVTVTEPLNIVTAIKTGEWLTVASSFTITGTGTSSSSKTISGLVLGRRTRVTVSSGYYASEEYSSGSIAPDWCDGGCYCYCPDGGVVADGEMCGGYYTSTASIKPKEYETTNITITLETNGSVYNPTLTLQTNKITFNGYKYYSSTSGNVSDKSITISKVEQYINY